MRMASHQWRREAGVRRCLLAVEALESRVVPSLLPAVSYEAGNNPTAVAVADFNNDAFADLAVPYLGGGVTILINASDGTFFWGGDYATGINSRNIVTADFNFDGNFVGFTYNANRKGINYGLDNIKGTGDDIIYNAGQAATNLIDELVYVGVGNAFWPGTASEIADTYAYVFENAPFYMSISYTVGTLGSGEASVELVAAPEPGTLLLLGSGLVGLSAGAWRRRRSRA